MVHTKVVFEEGWSFIRGRKQCKPKHVSSGIVVLNVRWSLIRVVSQEGDYCIYIYIYIYMCVCVKKKIVIERTRDLIYLKFVATDFFPKIISPSAGENSGDLV